MRFLSFLASISIFFIPVRGICQESDILGNWERRDGAAKAIIYRCGAKYCARNIWVRTGARFENLNDTVVITITREQGQTLSGEAYSSNHDAKLAIEVQVYENSLRTKGCLLGGIICKTWSWQRLPD